VQSCCEISYPVLTWIVFTPLAGALLILALGKRNEPGAARWIALLTTLVNLALCACAAAHFSNGTAKMQFDEQYDWIPGLGISYHIGMDGISFLLIMLTSILMVVSVLSSWNYIKKNFKEYYMFLLLLQVGMMGVFLSLDLFLFYVFWEVMLIPMYFLIGIWGGERRIYAAVKFFIYTMVGSVLMLVAILTMFFMHRQAAGFSSFDLMDINRVIMPAGAQLWLFGAFALAFAIKVPMFPFHTWLPDAHVEAPTAGSVILAGVLLKMGTYGFLRFAMPLFPYAVHYFAPLICVLAVIGIVYGALVAMVQTDVKKLVAYSSVSHLGFVMLGLFCFNIIGLEGGMLQMINHGFSTGALFLLVGMLYERRHTRLIAEFGGLAKVMPAFFVVFLITTLSSVGLPGLNGFVGEFLVLNGAWGFSRVLTIVAATGVILAAIYMLWMFQRVMYGQVRNPKNQNLEDLSAREYLVIIPMVLFMFIIGIYPHPFLRSMDKSAENFLQAIDVKYRASLRMPADSDKPVILQDLNFVVTDKE